MLILMNFSFELHFKVYGCPIANVQKIFSVSCNANYFVPRSVNYDIVVLTHAANATLEWSGDL